METYNYSDCLISNRLLTRFLTKNDVATWTEFFRDKEAIELFPIQDSNNPQERAKQWIEKQVKRYTDNRFGLQALVDKISNTFIGQCGLLGQEVDGEKEIEVGYHILKKYWGHGFAPEGAKLFIDYAFKNNLTTSVISIIDKRNIKSQRVAEKNKLVCERETKWLDLDVYIFRIHKKDWKNTL